MSDNRDEQQQQQHIPTRIMNSNTFNTNANNTTNFNNNNNDNNAHYPNNPTFQQPVNYSNNNPYILNSNEPINNYYQLQQQQQQLYQPQHQPQYTFQTFVPAQPPSLQQFSDPIIPTEPDEFIMDLLRKPQERLFLLKLELEIEAFIKDEKKLRLDLPGMNSYQRLMVHRLAPYFKLNHYHDAMRKAVYVCKTFITELPSVRLQDVRLDDTNTESSSRVGGENKESNTQSGEENVTTSQPTPQFKIMRRSAGSSPSRSSSNDDSSKEGRKNMTLEERKTAYEEARARIFQNLEGK